MHLIRAVLFALSLAATVCHASPTSPVPGADYVKLGAAQPTQATGKKIEVIEFFMYHCPACNMLEPELAAWVKARGDKIVFRRIHMARTGDNDPEAHMFLTLEAMNLSETLHNKLLATWHIEHRRLASDEDNIEWAVKNGIDKAKFLSVYQSFSVSARLRNLNRQAASYQVSSTPSLVVDGRFMTSPQMVASANKGMPNQNVIGATLQVLDALIATAAKDK
jgi:thiol:disulfide interchange protein DsbA